MKTNIAKSNRLTKLLGIICTGFTLLLATVIHAQDKLTIDGDLDVTGKADLQELEVSQSKFITKKIPGVTFFRHDAVVLLHPIYDDIKLPENFAVGTLFASRGAVNKSNRKDFCEISTGSSFNKSTGWVRSLGGQWELKTFYYNGTKYVGVELPYANPQYFLIYFEGFYQSSSEQMQIIHYYDRKNQTITNPEVYNSIQDFIPNQRETVNTLSSRFTQQVIVGNNVSSNSKIIASGVIESSQGGFKLPDGTVIDEAADLGSSTSLTTPSGDSAVTVQGDGSVVIGDTTATHPLNIAGDTKIDGNVGIGVSTPQENLHVGGNTRIDGALYVEPQGGIPMLGDTPIFAGTNPLNAEDGTPEGTVITWATDTPPPGYLVCDGTEVLISEYTDLFAVLGTTYGGNGTTTFALPDYRGLFLRGVNNGRSDSFADPDVASRTDRGDGTTGDVVGTLQQDEFKSHTHNVSTNGGSVTSQGDETVQSGTGAVVADHWDTGISIQSTGGSETRPQNITVLYCIKY